MHTLAIFMIVLPIVLSVLLLTFLSSTIKSRKLFLQEMSTLNRTISKSKINIILIVLTILFISSLESCSQGNSGQPVTRWQHIQQMRETSNMVFNQSTEHTPDQIKYHAIQIHTIDSMLNSELMTIIKK